MSSFSLSRRRFALGAAIAATASVMAPKEAASQAANPASGSTPNVNPQTDAAMAKLSLQARAEVEMKVAEILRKHGDKLSEDQKADVRKVMAETQDGLEKMRAFALDNGDQPATVFHAYRSEDIR